MEDKFKELFKGIMFILVLVVVLLCLSITFHSCRSQKQATATTVENVEVAKAASSTTETAARSQWMSSLNIDLDSFEMIMPYVDTPITFPNDSLYTIHNKPYTTSEARIILRGKRASIGKSDLAERNASRCARQVDSVASHRTMDKQELYAREAVGIYKPPNVTWWPLMILAALALIAAIRHFLRSKW